MYSPAMDNSTTSSANIALGSVWLNHCLQNHPGCASPSLTTIPPRRLINIRNPLHVFLEDKTIERKEYIALSYKWGSNNRYLSRTSNIDEHYQLVPLNALPKTFIDAIHVSHKLGFHHLWIDALCILQDSVTERSQEMDRMGEIFKGATLTLFAEAADDAGVGLACVRDPRHVKPCRLDFYVTIAGKPNRTCTFVAPQISHFRPYRRLAPLRQRGWVLQEEVAAVRALSFGHLQMEWDCHSSICAEARPGPLPSFTLEQEEKQEQAVATMHEDNGFFRGLLKFQDRNSISGGPVDPLRAWYSLVGDYSSRSLTYASDVLPALAGLATIMARTQRLHYANGVWKEHIVYGLLWRAEPRGDPRANDMNPVDVALQPSWTWTSHWGLTTSYMMLLTMKIGMPIVEVDWCHEAIHDAFEVLSEECSFAHVGHDQRASAARLNAYQDITTRTLTLTGYVNTGIVDYLQEPRMKGPWCRAIRIAQDQCDLGSLYFDRHPEKVRFDEVTLLLCATSISVVESSIRELSLALVSTGRKDEYKRVGIVANIRPTGAVPYDAEKHLPTELWKHRMRRTIVLI